MSDALLAKLREHIGLSYGPVFAWDRVDEALVRHWREALAYPEESWSGDAVRYGVPATMLPVWLMPGLSNRMSPGSDARDNRAIMRLLEAEGYQGVLGTNAVQEYVRPLRFGERISSTYEVEAVSERKKTKFGFGYFVTFLQRFSDEQGEPVGTLRLTILRFRPNETEPSPAAADTSPTGVGRQGLSKIQDGT